MRLFILNLMFLFKFKENLLKYSDLVFLIFLFTFLRLLFVKFYGLVQWDALVYLGMGQYFASFGQYGFLEAVRPVVLPFVLGLFYTLSLDAVFFGQVFIYLCTIFVAIVVYLISEDMFNKRTAFYASTIYLFNVLVLYWSFQIYTDIFATGLFLLGFLLILKKRYFWSGMFLSLSVLTRYPLVIILIPIELYFLYEYYIEKNKDAKNNFILFNKAGLMLLIFFMLFNFFSYENMFRPIVQVVLSSSWHSGKPLYFDSGSLIYIKTLFGIFHVLMMFFLIGAYDLIKNKKKEYTFILLLPLFVIFGFFQIITMKEERYILPLLPFICIISSYVLSKLNYKIARVCLVLFYCSVSMICLSIISDKITIPNNIYSSDIAGEYCSFDSLIVSTNPESMLKYPRFIPFYSDVDNYKIQTLLNKSDCLFYSSCDFMGVFPLDLVNTTFRESYRKNVFGCEQILFTKN